MPVSLKHRGITNSHQVHKVGSRPRTRTEKHLFLRQVGIANSLQAAVSNIGFSKQDGATLYCPPIRVPRCANTGYTRRCATRALPQKNFKLASPSGLEPETAELEARCSSS